MKRSRDKLCSYNLPAIPQVYIIQLDEANVAIREVQKELDLQPISIKTLNIRVDTARDLVLKLYNTSNEAIKTAIMVETAIIYGNRYRPMNGSLNNSLDNAEDLFFKGEYKKALECTIKAISVVEPNIYDKILTAVKK